MEMTGDIRHQVFISYSHADRDWLEKLHTHLKPYVKGKKFSIWDDTSIRTGADWRSEIEGALAMAKVAILLVSADFLASEFIAEHELLPLLESAKKAGLVIIWIAVSASAYKETEIERYQAANDPSKPLDSLTPSELNKELVRICEQIKEIVSFTYPLPAFVRRPYFDHLIETHTRLFAGREDYIETILDFIKSNTSGYIFVESLSGYGKTSLLAKLVQSNPHFSYHFISQAYKTHGSDFDPTEMDSLLLNLCEQFEGGASHIDGRLSPRARFHSMLRTPLESGSRVIVIDAVDEVNKHPNYLLGLFPEKLPSGIFIIMSARKLGDRDYLSEIGLRRRNIDKTIVLQGLTENAIAELLMLVGGKAIAIASSKELVTKLYQISNGDPFYLRFLVEDIAQGVITHNNIQSAPLGLAEYLDIQFSILDRSVHLPQQRDVLGIILEAYSPVSRNDLISMVEGLDGLNFQNVIRDIHRFLLVYEDMYTFCHSRFKEYFLSRASSI
jgi:hypothetical protein